MGLWCGVMTGIETNIWIIIGLAVMLGWIAREIVYHHDSKD